MKITDVNCETGEVIVREPTEQEIVQAQQNAEIYQQTIAALEAKKNAKDALLDKLGITEEEAKLLLS